MNPENYITIFKKVAEKRGWEINPEQEMLLSFAEGLIENKKRYGIPLCPCRLATEQKEIDKLIICPCVYAEEDIKKYHRCYCGLYLSKNYQDTDLKNSIPDQHFQYYFN